VVCIEASAAQLPLEVLVEQRRGYEPLTAALAGEPDAGVDSNVRLQGSFLSEGLVADLKNVFTIRDFFAALAT